MREISCESITSAVAELCIRANRVLPREAEVALRAAENNESWPLAKSVLHDLTENLDVARAEALPICQDTGLVSVYITMGQEVYITGGALNAAVNEGVRRGYTEGYLRKSVVRDPLRRVNTGDNTPCAIHLTLVEGEEFKILVMPKGAGSENMCRVKMLTPAEGEEGVKRFVLDSVLSAGGNPCPPVVVGVGIGGSFDTVAAIAKSALRRPVGTPNADGYYAAMEAELLAEINASGIGPQGLGGATTALAVHIASAPTHIAMLPAAVCISCHALRLAEVTL